MARRLTKTDQELVAYCEEDGDRPCERAALNYCTRCDLNLCDTHVVDHIQPHPPHQRRNTQPALEVEIAWVKQAARLPH